MDSSGGVSPRPVPEAGAGDVVGGRSDGRLGHALAGSAVYRCRSWPPVATVLTNGTSREVLAMIPTGRAGADRGLSRIGCRSLSRGVSVWLIHETGGQRSASEISALVDAGAQARAVDRVAQVLLVFDRSAALLATGVTGGNDLLITEPALVESLSVLFSATWRHLKRGTPADEPSLAHRAVLQLMSRGTTDASAAPAMGVSLRTYRRHVADVMARLGAGSRFQAGALAVGREWIGDGTIW